MNIHVAVDALDIHTVSKSSPVRYCDWLSFILA